MTHFLGSLHVLGLGLFLLAGLGFQAQGRQLEETKVRPKPDQEATAKTEEAIQKSRGKAGTPLSDRQRGL